MTTSINHAGTCAAPITTCERQCSYTHTLTSLTCFFHVSKNAHRCVVFADLSQLDKNKLFNTADPIWNFSGCILRLPWRGPPFSACSGPMKLRSRTFFVRVGLQGHYSPRACWTWWVFGETWRKTVFGDWFVGGEWTSQNVLSGASPSCLGIEIIKLGTAFVIFFMCYHD